MKNKMTIQLFNAETGELEKETVDYNMITNAPANLLNPGMVMDVWQRNVKNAGDVYFLEQIRTNPLVCYTPLLNAIYGGLLIFDTAITEDANTILPNKALMLANIGHASGTYTGTDTYRGSLNTTESGAITNGYRFVWDFTSSQACGTVRACSLTSFAGGTCGLKHDPVDDTSLFSTYGVESPTQNQPSMSSQILAWMPYIKNDLDGFYLTSTSNENMYVCKISDDKKSYIIKKYVKNPNINISTDIKEGNGSDAVSLDTCPLLTLESTNTITTTANLLMNPQEAIISGNILTSITTSYVGTALTFYITRIDLNATQVIDGKTVNIPIKTEEKTVTLPNIELDYNNSYGGYFSFSSYLRVSALNGNLYMIYKNYVDTNFKMLIVKESTHEYYTIDLPAEIATSYYKHLTPHIFTDTLMLLYSNKDNPTSKMRQYAYLMLNDNTFVKHTLINNYENSSEAGGDMFYKMINNPLVFKDPIFIMAGTKGNDNRTRLNLNIFNPFLSTINNLSEDVVKQNTQTMKVTYELTTN